MMIASKTQLEVVYYTDPLCCWSWAFEPHWQRLLTSLAGRVSYRYCMGGLIESWKNYNDDINAVSRAVQMGPVWMQAGHIGDMPICDNIWVTDPPASSYLPCIAVKAAGIQSAKLGEECLNILREAVMSKGINIDKQSVILQIVNTLPGIDIKAFESDLINGKANKLFAADLQEVRYRNITRFPTLMINDGLGKGIVITGYQPYDVLMCKLKENLDVLKIEEVSQILL